MRHKYMRKKVIICRSSIIFIFLFISTSECHAVDMQVLQEQCADIGFKIKTPANGKCVLQLMQSVKNREAQALAEQRAYESKVAAENAQRQQEAALRKQQAEMFELQKRSIAAQEAAANAQREAIDNDRQARAWSAVGESLQRQYGTGAYAPQPPPLPTPRAPITCNSFGQTTTCY